MADPLLDALQRKFPVGAAVERVRRVLEESPVDTVSTQVDKPAETAPPALQPTRQKPYRAHPDDWKPALPLGPYEYATTAPKGEHPGKGHVYIVDATGRKIGVVWGPPDTKMALAVAIIRASGGKPAFDWDE